MATVVHQRMKQFVGGPVKQGNETHSVRSPWDGSIVGEVPWSDATEAQAAIDAAQAAMASPLPGHRRAQILEDVASELRKRKSEFAQTITLESGKPITSAAFEVDRAIQTLIFSAAAVRTLTGQSLSLDSHPAGEGRLAVVLKVPIGVVAAITPFNFPLNLAVHKIGPALAAGCACVLKPADKTPISGFLLAELFAAAGLPPGWLNVVLGDAEKMADVFVHDDRVKAISFTGSAEVGWQLRAKAFSKKVLLELGNSTPVIVLRDADLEQAAAAIAAHGFGFAGQTCISIQRVYAERSIAQELTDRLFPKITKLKMGDPLDPETQVGPLITEASRDRVLAWISEAKAQGAKVLTGGVAEGSRMVHPTLLTNVTQEMSVCCREVFGPVVALSEISNLKDAIHLANGTCYGLQAGIFTNNINAALEAAAHLEFGGVMINESPSYRTDQMPYGGIKNSGNTREGPSYTIDELTERRLVVFRMPPG